MHQLAGFLRLTAVVSARFAARSDGLDPGEGAALSCERSRSEPGYSLLVLCRVLEAGDGFPLGSAADPIAGRLLCSGP